MNRAPGTCVTITKHLTFVSLESKEKRRKRGGLKSSERNNDCNSLNLAKDIINLQI